MIDIILILTQKMASFKKEWNEKNSKMSMIISMSCMGTRQKDVLVSPPYRGGINDDQMMTTFFRGAFIVVLRTQLSLHIRMRMKTFVSASVD